MSMKLSQESINMFLVSKAQFDEYQEKIKILVFELTQQLRQDVPDINVYEVCELLETFEIKSTGET